MRILVTGGAGYIGSHTSLELMERGHEVVVIDNHANSSGHVLTRLEALAGRCVEFHRMDLRDHAGIRALLGMLRIDAVIHFAALKSVGESCSQPLEYFDNNICGTISLLRAMDSAGVRRLVFSSSASVYGTPDAVPVAEAAALSTANPYGRTKLVAEQLIEDACRYGAGLRAVNLRYFNPVGAHASGMIGEDPGGPPGNLMPYICQVASGLRDKVHVFGGDWPTKDGTGVRDYIHVMDLARAHVDALEHLAVANGCIAINIGTGRGVSVLELIQAFERANGVTVPYEIVGRREGDVAEVYADPGLGKDLLGWSATRSLDTMCRDAWNWQRLNPAGYGLSPGLFAAPELCPDPVLTAQQVPVDTTINTVDRDGVGSHRDLV